jgi:hypothetical protein
MTLSILNRKIRILPDIDIESFCGEVILAKYTSREAILIKLECPFYYQSMYYEYIVAFPRQSDYLIDDLLKNKRVFCSLIKIPPKKLETDDPFDTSWWRGGGAFLGDIEPESCNMS